MLHHAYRVNQQGVYLELPDLLLYALENGVRLNLILNTTPPQTMSAEAYLKSILLGVLSDDELNALLTRVAPTGETWDVCLTRNDYAPTQNLQDMQHWVPCWSKEQVLDFEQLFQSSVQKQHACRDELEKTLMEQNWYEYCRLRARSDNFETLLGVLYSLDMAARDVPGDGDCGVWSLLCLEKQELIGHSQGFDEFTAKNLLRIRGALSSLWANLSNDMIWQNFLEYMVPSARADAAKALDHGLKEPKQETEDAGNVRRQATPQRTRKRDTALDALDELDGPSAMRRLTPPRPSKRSKTSQSAGLVKPLEQADSHMKSVLEGALNSLSHGSSSKQEPKTSKEELNTKEVKESKEEDDHEEGANPDKRKRKTRARPKRDENALRLKATKTYLGKIGAKYGYWQKVHYAQAMSNKTATCSFGGYKTFSEKLTSGTIPKDPEAHPDADKADCCSMCLQVLQSKKFKWEALCNFVDDFVAGKMQSSKVAEEDHQNQEAMCEDPDMDGVAAEDDEEGQEHAKKTAGDDMHASLAESS